jgi:hypothetical protein
MALKNLHKARAVIGARLGRGTPLSHCVRRSCAGRDEDTQLERFMASVDRLLYAAVVACAACLVAIVLR